MSVGSLEPHPLTPEDIELVHASLGEVDKLSQLFSNWGYPLQILDGFFREDFTSSTPEHIGQYMNRAIRWWYERVVEDELEQPLTKMLVGNNVTLAMRCFLICHPHLVRVFEIREGLPPTGDYYLFVDNFRQKRYTLRSNFSNDTAYRANTIKHDHLDNLRGLEPLTQIEHIIHDALLFRSQKILDYILKNHKYDKNVVLGFAAKFGNLVIFESMLAQGAVIGRKLAAKVGSGGNLTIAKMVLAVPKLGDAHMRCLVTAARNGRVELINYILNLKPELKSRLGGGDIRSSEYDIFLDASTASKLFIHCLQHCRSHRLVSDLPCFRIIVNGYGQHLSQADIETGVLACIPRFDYTGFDMLMPLVEAGAMSSQALQLAVIANSRYFFDRLLPYIRDTSSDISSSLIESMSSMSQSYFFEALFERYTFTNTTYERALVYCIRSDDREKFDRVRAKITPDYILYNAARHTYYQANIKYFLLLTAGWNRDNFIFMMQNTGSNSSPVRPCRKILTIMLNNGVTQVYREAVRAVSMKSLTSHLAHFAEYMDILTDNPGQDRVHIRTFLMEFLFSDQPIYISPEIILKHPQITTDDVIMALMMMYNNRYIQSFGAYYKKHLARCLNQVMSMIHIPCIEQAQSRVSVTYAHDGLGYISEIASLELYS